MCTNRCHIKANDLLPENNQTQAAKQIETFEEKFKNRFDRQWGRDKDREEEHEQ